MVLWKYYYFFFVCLGECKLCRLSSRLHNNPLRCWCDVRVRVWSVNEQIGRASGEKRANYYVFYGRPYVCARTWGSSLAVFRIVLVYHHLAKVWPIARQFRERNGCSINMWTFLREYWLQHLSSHKSHLSSSPYKSHTSQITHHHTELIKLRVGRATRSTCLLCVYVVCRCVSPSMRSGADTWIRRITNVYRWLNGSDMRPLRVERVAKDTSGGMCAANVMSVCYGGTHSRDNLMVFSYYIYSRLCTYTINCAGPVYRFVCLLDDGVI